MTLEWVYMYVESCTGNGNDIIVIIIIVIVTMGSYLRKVVTALSQPEMILLFLAASVRHTGEELPFLTSSIVYLTTQITKKSITERVAHPLVC